MTTPRIEEMIGEFEDKFCQDITTVGSYPIASTIRNWVRKALAEAHQAGKIQALQLLEDLYAKAEDKAELIEMFNEALQDNK